MFIRHFLYSSLVETRCGISSQVSYIYPFDPTKDVHSHNCRLCIWHMGRNAHSYHHQICAEIKLWNVTAYNHWGRIHVQGIEESLLFAVIKSIVLFFLVDIISLQRLIYAPFIDSINTMASWEEQWNTVFCCWLYRIARSNVLSLSPQISGKSLLFWLQHQGGSGMASIQWIPGYLLPTGLGIEARSSVRRVTIGQDRSSRDAFVERKKNLGILRHQASTSKCVKVLLPTFKSNTAISVHHIAPWLMYNELR